MAAFGDGYPHIFTGNKFDGEFLRATESINRVPRFQVIDLHVINARDNVEVLLSGKKLVPLRHSEIINIVVVFVIPIDELYGDFLFRLVPRASSGLYRPARRLCRQRLEEAKVWL